MGPPALRLEARLVGPNEGTNIVGHVEQLGPLLLVEGDREAAEADRPPFSLTRISRTRVSRSLVEVVVIVVGSTPVTPWQGNGVA